MVKGKEKSYPVASRAEPVDIEENENENKNKGSIELSVEAVEYEENIVVSYGLKVICPSRDVGNHYP